MCILNFFSLCLLFFLFKEWFIMKILLSVHTVCGTVLTCMRHLSCMVIKNKKGPCQGPRTESCHKISIKLIHHN